MLLLSNWIYFT